MADRNINKSSSSIISTEEPATSYNSITPPPAVTICTEQEKLSAIEKKLIRKIDFRYIYSPRTDNVKKENMTKFNPFYRLIPWLSVLYLLLSLDRNNIGNARLGSLEKDLNLVGNDYYTALTIFFAGT